MLLVEALYLQGFELEETQRFVNWELVANGQRPVSERTIDLDRSRMNELWRERPRGWLACDPPKSVYQPRRTAKPMDAYMPAPEAPAEPAPPRQPPGVKTQTVEDLMVDDLPDEVEPDTTPRTDSSVLERASAFAQPAESSGPKIQRFEDLLEQDQELLEQDLEEEAEPW